jgi:hypothetical protein
MRVAIGGTIGGTLMNRRGGRVGRRGTRPGAPPPRPFTTAGTRDSVGARHLPHAISLSGVAYAANKSIGAAASRVPDCPCAQDAARISRYGGVPYLACHLVLPLTRRHAHAARVYSNTQARRYSGATTVCGKLGYTRDCAVLGRATDQCGKKRHTCNRWPTGCAHRLCLPAVQHQIGGPARVRDTNR